MEIKKKKQEMGLVLDLFDIIEVIVQIIGWLIRGIFHLIAKLLN